MCNMLIRLFLLVHEHGFCLRTQFNCFVITNIPFGCSILTLTVLVFWFTAPCSVNIARGRILYKGRRLWIEHLKPNKVLHNENVSFYCLNAAGGCGYAVSSQCINGNLSIPDCFEGELCFMSDNG